MHGLFLSRIEGMMRRAAHLANASGSRIIFVPHLLTSLFAEPEVRKLWRECGAGAVPVDIADLTPKFSDDQPFDITPGVRIILELAREEAVADGHGHIAPEHVLLGLMRAAEDASLNPVWYPYIGCVAPREERESLMTLRRCAPDAGSIRDYLKSHPRRTLLRAANGSDATLLRPAGASTAIGSESLLTPTETKESNPVTKTEKRTRRTT